MFECRCECGTVKVVPLGNIKHGKSKSCGCMVKTITASLHSTHQMSKSRVYGIWSGMMTRCYNKESSSYKRYGGKGIRVSDRWKSFENFYADMGDPPEDHSIDRINNNGNYEPGNCRWATRSEQASNTSRTLRVVLMGNEMSLKSACKEIGVSYVSTRRMMIRRKLTPQQIIDYRMSDLPKYS